MTNEELASAIQNEGRKERRAELLAALWIQNTGIIKRTVWHYAQTMKDPQEAAEDLTQECFFALLDAVATFNEGMGCKFTTHAAYYLKRRIIRVIMKNRPVAVPAFMLEEIRKVDRIQAEHMKKCGRMPGRVVLWREYGIKPSQYDQIMLYKRRLYTKSLSDPITGKDGSTAEVGEIIPSGEDLEGDITDKIRQEELETKLWAYVDALEPKESDIIRARYQRGEDLQHIAKRYGTTTQAISAAQRKAFQKLATGKTGKDLREYISDAQIYQRGLRRTNFASTWYSSTEAAAEWLFKQEERAK